MQGIYMVSSSDDGAIGDDGVLDDHDNPVLDDKAFTLPVALPDALLVHDLHIGSDPGVLVHNRPSHG